MIIHNCEQYSPEWWAVRRGIPTASSADKIVTPKGAFSTQSRGLMHALMADAIGLGDPPFEPTEWMLRGKELEPEARAAFTFMTDLPTLPVGFVTNETATAGCSPDSMIPARDATLFDDMTADVWQVPSNLLRAGLELKCPKPSTHIGYLLADEVPSKYIPQCHWSMATSNVKQWYFMSYHPDMDPLIKVVEWDEYTEAMVKAIARFADVMNDAKAQLPTLFH